MRILPTEVYDLGCRLGVDPKAYARLVRLKQTGRMKTRLDSDSWMAFTATQTLSTTACAFDWCAHVGPFGVISARDALVDGEGRLDVMAFGCVPLALTKHTSALIKGELMRYLAEIAWAPAAIFHNKSLHWRIDGPDTIAVMAGQGDTASEVILSLDSDGRIASTYAPDRPRSATAPTLPTPWHGRFSDYRKVGKVWLPFAGEVAWAIEGTERLYWQGKLTDWSKKA